ncbi:class I SAM-dependent methyltransferase [Rahnella sp. NRRL B-41462]|uniref:class I SAM-dependent methyltransferase n=1 Tax=Rahnella sp. NRRL B-41462 TaxID=1610579 RepID=UPI000DD4160E|nr:class I SAM-dependent methyltransferase [Rahnella sp. NRRL B-41462]
MSNSTKAGHTFLASLGKTRLRPGGIEATEWLISQAQLNSNSKVLEVACNIGTTAIELTSRFGCDIYAIDMDQRALRLAQQRVESAGLNHKVHLIKANATRLPFADACFDIIINEAMLTMYADKAKHNLVHEYCRVLKPGGCLLTHDIMLTGEKLGEIATEQLQQVVKSHVSPMSRQGWVSLLLEEGFSEVQTHHGVMSLMSPLGLIKDEGLFRALKIAFNGLKNHENRLRFFGMFHYFRAQRHRLNFIACCAKKK